MAFHTIINIKNMFSGQPWRKLLGNYGHVIIIKIIIIINNYISMTPGLNWGYKALKYTQ